MMNSLIDKSFLDNRKSLFILLFISLIYFLENFDRYLIAVSPVPYIDYSSYEYSILSGPAFTIVYSFSGLLFSLYYKDNNLNVYETAVDTDTTTKEHYALATSIIFTKFNILMIATIIFSISFGLTAYAIYFYQLVLIRIIMGISQSIVTPFSISIISDHFSIIHRGTAFSIFNSGTYFAFSLSLSLGTYLYVTYGWKFGYVLFAIIGIILGCILPVLSCYEYYISLYEKHYKAINNIGDNVSTTNRIAEDCIDTTTTILCTSTMNEIDKYDYKPPHVIQDHVYSLLHSDHSEQNNSNIKNYNDNLNDDINDNINDNHINNQIINKNKDTFYNRLLNMKMLLYEITCKYWYQQPGIIMLCLATGIRIGAGYIWASYTSVYFSDLFVQDIDSSCKYSYNSSIDSSSNTNVCSSDFPYCVNGECNQLTSFPWHNKGLDSLYLEEYMSWVPIVGSAFGSFLGGIMSDYLINRHQIVSVVATDSSTSNILSVANYRTNTTEYKDQSLRMLIASISNILALPLVLYSLELKFPYCFIILIASGMVGELYLSQSLTYLSDSKIIPASLVIPSTALFMFIITLIGGNIPLLVPFMITMVGYKHDADVSFDAESLYTGDMNTDASTVRLVVKNQDSKQLQYSLMYLLGGCYGLASIFYFISYLQMKRIHLFR